MRRTSLLLALGLLLVPEGASAETCSDGAEWLELEQRSVTRLDGSDAEPEETEKWRSQGDAVVGYMNDSFQRQEDTVRLEGIYEPGALRVTLTEED